MALSKRKSRFLPKIEYRKLGRENAKGFCYVGEDRIEIDPRLSGYEHLEVLTHELIHHFFPDLSETDTLRIGGRMSKAIWNEGYREIIE